MEARIESVQVRPHVWRLADIAGNRCYLIVGDERAALVDGTQAVRRVSALGADPEDFQRPELYRKALRAYVNACLADIASKAKRELVYDGESLSGLNEFMAALNGQPARVAVTAEALEMDETLYVPTGILLEGNGARLVPGEATLVKAIVLDGPENCAVNGLVIEGGCDYGIYVKNAHGFQLRGNAVSGATYKGIVVMGDCDRFAIADNDVHENLNGGIFLNGNISLGLIEGLAKIGKNVGGALRQPSGGPTMNVKGTAAGGGNALLMPMTEFSLGLTGDINDIMNAHNLAMVALNARMQHERNYTDEEMAKHNMGRRLDIDPKRIEMGWVLDFCAQGLRNIIMGIGGNRDGFLMESRPSPAT